MRTAGIGRTIGRRIVMAADAGITTVFFVLSINITITSAIVLRSQRLLPGQARGSGLVAYLASGCKTSIA